MKQIDLDETQVLVVADAEEGSARNARRGRLFEIFTAQVLSALGYEEPTFENLNITANGFEVDVAVRHALTRREAIAECKAHATPVHTRELTNFVGKRYIRTRSTRYEIDGFFFALPRLTSDGVTAARELEREDASFRYLDASQIADLVEKRGLVSRRPESIAGEYTSDPTLVIAHDGLFFARKVLDPETRTPREVAIWHVSHAVPTTVMELVAQSTYASGVRVRDVNTKEILPSTTGLQAPTVVEVVGSQSDFEYQLPASPRYFVGRSNALASLQTLIRGKGRVLVVNAKSGCGGKVRLPYD